MSTISRLVLEGVFGSAGVLKLGDLEGFAFDLHAFQLTPWAASKVLAFYLPFAEIFAAIGLFTRRWHLGAVFGLLLLTGVFGVALGSAWIRGLDLSCGCFGSNSELANYPLHLAGIGLLLICAWVTLRHDSRFRLAAKEKLETPRTVQ